jgi:hypothetical protein
LAAGSEQLILSDGAQEHECRRFLRHPAVIPHLCHQQPDKVISVTEEDQGFFGRSDFCLTVQHDDGSNRRVATYIWELKAPRCPLFRAVTKARLMPSMDLIEAENQLLHYVYEAQNSELFQRRFHVIRENIHPGGIIIGMAASKIAGAADDNATATIFEITKGLRELYFYRAHHIRLWLWDKVARIIEAAAKVAARAGGQEGPGTAGR